MAPLKALSAYGMTEMWVGAALSALDDDAPHRLETSGYPAPGYEFRVVDPETGERLPDGVPGELRVKSYALMEGYCNKPKETAECYDADGWFCTRDMAEQHADGYIRFLGRFKAMLKVGGENVDPMEVSRGPAARTRGRPAGRSGRIARPPASGGAGRLRRTKTRCRDRRRGDHRLLPGKGRELQDSAPRHLHSSTRSR